MGIYDHNSVVIGLVSVEGNGKLSLAMAVVLLPAISLPSTLWIEHKQPKMIKTYIDRIVGYVWAVFGLGGFFVSWVSIFFWNMSVLLSYY